MYCICVCLFIVCLAALRPIFAIDFDMHRIFGQVCSCEHLKMHVLSHLGQKNPAVYAIVSSVGMLMIS